MDEIAALSHEIEFHEKFRGYDPDEVDAYVDRVRKVAALVSGRIEELHHRAEAAESLIAAGRVDSAEETLGRTLLLAQQTADELVVGARAEAERITSEARESAEKLISESESKGAAAIEQARAQADTLLKDAENRSSRMLAEAETDRRELIRRSEAEASTAAEQERHKLSAEVSELSAARDYLRDDIDILERHVREQRANLSLVVSSLTDLVEQPGAFQLDPAPATSDVSVSPSPSEEVSEETADIPLAGDEVSAETNLTQPEEESPDVASDATPDDPDDPENSATGAEISAELRLVEGPEIGLEPAGHHTSSEMSDEVIDLDDLEADPVVPTGLSTSDEPDHSAEPDPPRLVTAADLGESADLDAHVDAGPATAPVAIVSGEPLFTELASDDGAPTFAPRLAGLSDGDLLSDDNDDALSAFFDQDGDDTDRSWFGRRR